MYHATHDGDTWPMSHLVYNYSVPLKETLTCAFFQQQQWAYVLQCHFCWAISQGTM